ncbi:HAMP domain-containing sensor histidine kinase [Streptomyces montanisoli]|uniref:histidine kinase n=1 Tax=Streptomyces montanisoli TaxID=2798581 RepID=A0A940M988_9ACTN|nr:ATP-binding protein [Streptomyces montanisoli]MBP0458625.1 HAMP domain-containing protein [Streptomyces montanisoli]
MLGHGSGVRTRIALIYGAVFVVLGAGLLGVVNLLSAASTRDEAAEIASRADVVPVWSAVPGAGHGIGSPGVVEQRSSRPARVTLFQLTDHVSDAARNELMFWSLVALLAMALFAVVVGWWTAGRVLRPVRAMTEKARGLSEQNLYERIAASGPDDELKELGDTLDALLARLENAFDSQRRFIANASHELRTPLATQRTAIQVGLDDASSPEELAETKRTLLDNNRRSEQLIEGLLVLARSERGLADEELEDVDLRELVAQEAARHGVAGPVDTRPVAGDAPDPPRVVRANRLLLSRLVANLLTNAKKYNVPGGTVDVSVEHGTLRVRNTGPTVPADEIPALFEPFRRGEGRDRLGGGTGAGLGLSIVRSIAEAHGGSVSAIPGRGDTGGLEITVTLPTTRTDRLAGAGTRGPGGRA